MVRSPAGYELFFSAAFFGWNDDERLSPYGMGYAELRQAARAVQGSRPTTRSSTAIRPPGGLPQRPRPPEHLPGRGPDVHSFHAWDATSGCRKPTDRRNLYIAPIFWKDGKPRSRPEPPQRERGRKGRPEDRPSACWRMVAALSPRSPVAAAVAVAERGGAITGAGATTGGGGGGRATGAGAATRGPPPPKRKRMPPDMTDSSNRTTIGKISSLVGSAAGVIGPEISDLNGLLEDVRPVEEDRELVVERIARSTVEPAHRVAVALAREAVSIARVVGDRAFRESCCGGCRRAARSRAVRLVHRDEVIGPLRHVGMRTRRSRRRPRIRESILGSM